MRDDVRKAGIMITMFVFGIVVLALYGSGSDALSRTMCSFGTGLVVGSITYYASNSIGVNKKAVSWLIIICLDFCISAVFGIVIAGLISDSYSIKTVVLGAIFIIIATVFFLIGQVKSLRSLYRR